MSDIVNNSPKKKNKKADDVTCWNCFKTNDSDLEPVPLSKIREEQRHNFKLYSVLASELSKPKAVSLKQKVSEHYYVGKKLDEKICKNTEDAKCLPDISLASSQYITTENHAESIKSISVSVEPLRKVDKSTETDCKITKVKISRSDSSSSSSSSTTPDFRPRRKIFYRTFTSTQSFDDTDTKVETKVATPYTKIFEDSYKFLPKYRNDSDENLAGLQYNRLVHASTPIDVSKSSINTSELKTKTILKSGRTNSLPEQHEIRSPKTSFQKRQELLSMGKAIDNSYSAANHSCIEKYSASTSSKLVSNSSSVESLQDKSADSKTDSSIRRDLTSPPKSLAMRHRSATLKEILNEHYSIDKEIDETIAKYANLTKSKPKTGKSDMPKDKEHVMTDTQILNQDTTPDKESIKSFVSPTEQAKNATTVNTDCKYSITQRSMSQIVNTDSDEIITKRSPSTISEKSYQRQKAFSNSLTDVDKAKTLTNFTNVMPIKTPRTRLKRQPIAKENDDYTGSLSSVSSSCTNERVTKLASKFESLEKLASENVAKTSSSTLRRHSSESQRFRNDFTIKSLDPLGKDRALAGNVEKGDDNSYNGSESGYAGSSGTVQDFQENDMISRYFEADAQNTKLGQNIQDSQINLNDEKLKTSLQSLNKTSGKKILKPLATSKSLSADINTAGTKSPSKSIRWSTLSARPKGLSFQDDVYMGDTLSSGNATLPRRSSSPLPNERDLDRDRFSINRSGLQARSESMASVYSGAGEGARGSVTVRGEVQFSLIYNYRLGALEVGVKRCRDLAPVDTKRNRSDPYVKVYLLPDKSKAGKRKTKVKKGTLCPVFEETLSFVQPLGALSSRTLWLSVWHADMFGRNDFLGEVTLPLADVVYDDPAPTWYKLHERTEHFDEQQGTRGDLIVGLKFESQDTSGRGKGTLHVLIKEAKNLVATKPNGLADVFCKSYLLPERGRLAKQKTSVSRRTLSPRWEHTFTYRGLSLQELGTRALELSLWDRDRLASNDFMGAVRLSLGTGTYMGTSVNWMDSMGKEVALWQTMMQRPNFWVEGSLPLRPQLNN